MSIPLSRRALLRGAGVSLGLPWLEAMIIPAAFASSKLPKNPVRLAVLYMPNGVNTDAWSPQGNGRDFTLSPTLAPLQDLKDQVVVMSNLWNAASKGGDGHYVKAVMLVTANVKSHGSFAKALRGRAWRDIPSWSAARSRRALPRACPE